MINIIVFVDFQKLKCLLNVKKFNVCNPFLPSDLSTFLLYLQLSC